MKKRLNPHLIELLARELHANQTRFDKKTPYIKHPEAVASMVKGKLNKQIAWLHDAIEDTPETEESLLARGVPPKVVKYVAVLTRRKGESYNNYIDRLVDSPRAVHIKTMDMLDNLSDQPTRLQVRRYASALKKFLKT